MANKLLGDAKKAKNDEFYTQYNDIQKQMNAFVEYNVNVFKNKTVLLPCDDPEWSNFTKFFAQNFENFGLKKLISTSYAIESKKYKVENWQPSLFEEENEKYDKEKTRIKGKIFILDRESHKGEKLNIDALEWDYLEGDGDFRSEEVIKLRDEADFIITNPPFSLFREFIEWLITSKKQFAIIGNINAITYKEVFPLIQENKLWTENPFVRGAGYFTAPYEIDTSLSYFNSHDYREGLIRVPGVRWYTNIETGRRHQPMELMTEADNIKFSKHKEIKGKKYIHYDNYDAIEVPFSDSIPSDYKGCMGVPISFLDKYCPEQFEIITMTKTPIGTNYRTKIYPQQIQHDKNGKESKVTKLNDGSSILIESKELIPSDKIYYEVDGKYYIATYPRIVIKPKVL